jgi:hypothetical protein
MGGLAVERRLWSGAAAPAAARRPAGLPVFPSPAHLAPTLPLSRKAINGFTRDQFKGEALALYKQVGRV